MTASSTEHRWPRADRSSYPTRWITRYGWRRIVAYSPKVRLRSLQCILDLLPRHGFGVGLWTQRDDEEEREVIVSLGVATLTINVMEWTA